MHFPHKTKIFKRKYCMKPYLLVIITIVLVAVVILGVEFYQDMNDSFQNFTYPSDENFHEILNAKNLSKYTVLNDYNPRLIHKVEVKASSSDTKVVVVVKSAMLNSEKRNNIRQTWASKKCQNQHHLVIYFSVGQPQHNDLNSTDIEEHLSEETKKYGDILQFNFVDAYFNNTYKVMAIMDHFVKFYPEVPYLLIVDDDFFVDPRQLMQTVMNQISEFHYPRFFGGYVWYHNAPMRGRSAKWYVTKEQYPFDFYPPYATGGFMLVSSPMVKACNRLLPYLKYTGIDDVLLGILLFKLNIVPTHLRNVIPQRPDHLPHDLLAFHGCNNMVELWHDLTSKKMC